MPRSVPPVPVRAFVVRLFLGAAVATAIAVTTLSAQIPGRNVNMVSGTSWPDGDPYLQRQNEPSIGASTRNPLHLLAGANDYRTVDLPGLAEDETGDAWLGLFKSVDGGQRWNSTLLPGYPQDHSSVGLASPIHGYGAGADPVVRAGTNGLMYYAGLVFDRASPATPDVPGKSAVFVSRYIDNNNKEAGDPFAYLGTRALQTDPGGTTGNFLDKPWMVVDTPRNTARCTIVSEGSQGPITQNLPAGPVYVAYTLRSTDNQGPRYDVMFTRSVDCGVTWTSPQRLNDSTERGNQGASMAIDPRNGTVYIAWRQFDLSSDNSGIDALVVAKYTFGSSKAQRVGFARKFAKPKKGKGKGLNLQQFFRKGGVNAALEAVQLSTLDQSTSALRIRFRTNAYPSVTVDETGRAYMVWAERGYDPLNPDPVAGSARVLIASSTDGATWTTAKPVASESQKGHQLMPSITYAGGRLMLIYYDIRETRSQSFTQFIEDQTAFNDPDGTGLRNTIDLRASMASPGLDPTFPPSVPVSEYIEGPRVPHGPNVPWQVNPPNLPMFQKGTAPFIGDYVDLTAAPNFVVDATGKWVYNTAASSTPPIFHAAWTDNRDVRVPLEDRNGDGNPWNDYAPPGALGTGVSIFDPAKTVPQCIPGNAGSRNQNIYTARITGGLLVGSPGNSKRLGVRLDAQGNPLTELMERSFVVFAQNTSDSLKRFRFAITNQPVGGRASFDQFSPAPLLSVDADIPYRSTASRTVYATSTDPHAVITVVVSELELVGQTWQVKAGGLSGVVILNPDIDNPDIDNPDIDNPDIDNPDIDNAEVYNPDIDNPDIDNPDIDNPDIDNPDIDNPDIDNVVVANPDIDNPDIDNPDIDNPDIDNPDIDNPDIDNPDIDNASLMTDVTWTITNKGNTTASYNVNLFFANQNIEPDIRTQLILYRTYKTPVVKNCDLKTETRNVLVANVPNPHLVTGSNGDLSNPNDAAATNATIYLAPGEQARITFRIFDPTPENVVQVQNDDGSFALISASLVPNEDVTPIIQQQSVNTEDREAGVIEPPPVVQFPPPQTVNDSASTAELTPVTLNVLANDSTAFGSTKVVSFHPAGMGSHSGGGPGDITYQPSTGYLYTARGIVDPATSSLIGRLPLPPANVQVAFQKANPRTGINYQRTGTNINNTAFLSALDARPDSPTFHQYLPMPMLSESVITFGMDTVHHRLYVMHGTQVATASSTTSFSAIDIDPSSPNFHTVLYTVALPVGVRASSVAVNTRTQQIYVGTAFVGGSSAIAGVFVVDGTSNSPAATRLTSSQANGVVVNESSNQVMVASSFSSGGQNLFQLQVIDGATLTVATIQTTGVMRFTNSDERLAVHEATGKVFMRLGSSVVVVDTKRGSPTRNTVLATIPVGADANNGDIAIDQEAGRVITTGAFDFRADLIDVATHSLVRAIQLRNVGADVTVDPVHHVGFVSTGLTSVKKIDLIGTNDNNPIPVFIEAGSPIVNPVTNRAYVTGTAEDSGIVILSGAGLIGEVPIANDSGRFNFSARYEANNHYFVVNQGNQAGTSAGPGTLVEFNGADDSIVGYYDTIASPFGLGIDQQLGKVYAASLTGDVTNGGLRVFNATNPGVGAVDANFTTSVTPTGTAFPLNFTGATIGFSRFVVPNPNDHRVYVTVAGGTQTSVAIYDPNTNVLAPLDGRTGTVLGDYQQAHGESWGRANIVRVNATLNRVYIGFDNGSVNRVVVIDGTSLQVLFDLDGGRHSNRHTASYLQLDESMNRLFVSDYLDNGVFMVDATTMVPVAELAVPQGPSAMALNLTSHRLYVSSIDVKTISAIDYTASTMTLHSSVKLPLLAYFMAVDEVESRLYTSGGDSLDESGAMVVTDIVGQLGTNVSVSGHTNAGHGSVTLNPDYSLTYQPDLGFAGVDTFSYTIQAPNGTATGNVTVTVVPVAPTSTAFPDTYATTINQPLSVGAPGPLGNDAAGSGLVTMVVDSATTNGQLTPQANGSFLYVPNNNFTGTDAFSYHAVSALGASNTVVVSLIIAQPTSVIVTTVNDTGAGSLRNALSIANSEPNSSISFNIPANLANANGLFVIQPASALPTATQPVVIDGYTQAGAAPNALPAGNGTNAVIKIQLVGSSAGNTNGLNIQGGASTIRGLSITNFTQNGILLDVIGNNIVEGNFLGVTPLGVGAGNSQNGLSIQSPNNTVGGALAGQRNLISGNTQSGIRVGARTSGASVLSDGTGTVIQNNLIGTNVTGLAALANSSNGISVGVPNVVIGGTTPALRNIISGNGVDGVGSNVQTSGSAGSLVLLTAPTNLVVQGNYIGVGVDGNTRVANVRIGVVPRGANSLIGGSTGTTPGGACTGACNVISGNSSGNQGGSINFNSQSDDAAQVVLSSAAGSVAEGNFIGLNAAGTTAIPAGTGPGIFVAASNVRIGGNTPAQRNVIAGNGSQGGISVGNNTFNGFPTVPSGIGDHVVISGNYVGLNSAGTAAMSTGGITITAPFATVGGVTAGERNIIVNSTGNGIFAGASTVSGNPATVVATAHHLTVQGNWIGVAPDGVTVMPNNGGVSAAGANAVIGGTTNTLPNSCAGACNLISGNLGSGLTVGNQFQNSGAANDGQLYSSADHSVVQGNFIGTNLTGTASIPNTGNGLNVNAPFVTVGGNTIAARNLVSGNGAFGINLSLNFVNATSTPVAGANNSVVQANYVGTTVNGLSALPNNSGGINVSVPDVTIGGAGAARNVISGNVGSGVQSFASRNGTTVMAVPSGLIVDNNYLGIKADGSGALGNTLNGVQVTGPNSQILNNVVSGNVNPVPGNFTAGIHILTNYENSSGPLGTIYSSPAGTVVYGNIVGLDPTGTTAIPNDWGIQLNAPNVTIGGSGPGQRNVVSGNNRNGIGLGYNYVTATNAPAASAAGSVVRSNYVGLNSAGTAAVPNAQAAMFSGAPNVTFGGPAAADGNFVVSAASQSAIGLGTTVQGPNTFSSGNDTIQNNVLGLTPTGGRLNLRGSISIGSAGNHVLDNIIAGNGTNASTSTAIGIFPNQPGSADNNDIRRNIIGTNAAGVIGLHNFGAAIVITNVNGTIIDSNTMVGGNDGGVFVNANGTASNNTVITGNRFGLMPDGITAQDPLNRMASGIYLTNNGGTLSGTTIGGNTAAARNVFGTLGNNAISLFSGVTNTTIKGNYIGVAADGTTARPSDLNGIWISDSSNTLVGGPGAGDGNVIANNAQIGVAVVGNTSVNNRVQRNSIFNNGGLGIDIGGGGFTANDPGDGDTGPNNFQNYAPIVSVVNGAGATQITYDSNALNAQTHTIEFFTSATCDASGFGEGATFIGSAVVNGSTGNQVFVTAAQLASGWRVTATITDPSGNTSEFSNCVPVP